LNAPGSPAGAEKKNQKSIEGNKAGFMPHTGKQLQDWPNEAFISEGTTLYFCRRRDANAV
jgi:hypothetical protein